MQLWSVNTPRAHVNHQLEEVKEELDVTLVYGEIDFEDTKTRLSLCVTLKDNCGGFEPLYSSQLPPVEAARQMYFCLSTTHLI